MSKYTRAFMFVILFGIFHSQTQSQLSDTATIRIGTYNTLGLGVKPATLRYFDLRVGMQGTYAQIIVLQEVVDTIYTESVARRAQKTAAPQDFVIQTGNLLLYDTSAIGYIDENIVPIGQKWASQYRLIVRQTGDTIVVYSCNLTKGADSIAQANREIEAQSLRFHIHTLALPYYIVAGTLNVSASTETSYRWLTDAQPFGDTILHGQVHDPVDSPGIWHDNKEFEFLHTSSTRILERDGGAGGGMIDRFDFILLSTELMNNSYVPNTYIVPFNNGKVFRDSIGSGHTNDPDYHALQNASDHLPVTLQLLINHKTSKIDRERILPPIINLSGKMGFIKLENLRNRILSYASRTAMFCE